MEIESIQDQEGLEELLNKQISQNKKLIKLSIGLSGITLLLAGFTAFKTFTLYDNLYYIHRNIRDIDRNISALNNIEEDNSNKVVPLKEKIFSIDKYVGDSYDKLNKLEENFREFEATVTNELGLNKKSEQQSSYSYFNKENEEKITLKDDLSLIKNELNEIKNRLKEIRDDVYWIRWFKN